MALPIDPGNIRRFGPDLLQLADPKAKFVFNPKDVLSAKVLKSLNPGQFLLSVRGNQIIAQSNAELIPGKVYLMEVKSVDPVPVLALAKEAQAESQGRALAKLVDGLRQSPFKDLMGLLDLKGEGAAAKAPPAAKEELQALSNLLSRLTLGGGKPLTADAVRNFVQNSGMMWESKLGAQAASANPFQSPQALLDNDLKALVMQLLSRPEMQNTPQAERLAAFVDNLQGLQLANVTAMEENGRFFLSVPFLQGGEHRFVQFMADLSRESGGKDEAGKDRLITASLCLDLSALGPIRADAALLGRFLRAGFSLSSQENADFLKARAHELESRLVGHGFQLMDLTFHVEEQSYLENISLADELFSEPPNGLDFVI
ncbi:flagellar hook-length control protein FliK [Desulfatibacillum aliphaticivorans]|uniref:flagellar hook-length control protein FliK n=1 Tax=Desulfatibacillum aliphaticivorans TaxID=218208 RepID=UPI000416B74A|nr:flagellar hook-length control protein FliK [Desulfatibacillum aliphaticivorans]